MPLEPSDEQVVSAGGGTHGRKSASRLSGAGRVWLLSALLSTVAAGLYFFPLQNLEQPAGSINIPWWALAFLFYLAEVCVVHVHIRREAHSFSLSEIPLVLGLFFAMPADLVLAQLLGTMVALAYHRRQSPLKLLFNLGHFFLETSLAALIFHGILTSADPTGPIGWIATFAATLTASVAAVIFVVLAISLAEGAAQVKALPQVLGFGTATSVTNTSLALVAATMLRANPQSTWLLLVPAAFLVLAYRAYTGMKQKHESLEFLYEATGVVHRSLEVEGATLALLSQARKMFRAEVAQITIFPSNDNDTALRTSLGPGDEIKILEPVKLDPTKGIWARIASEGQAILVSRPIQNKHLRSFFEERGMRDAMVAPLRGDTRVIGKMLVANRLGDVSTFDTEDLKLFETLANHASVSLENAWLVDRLREEAADKEHQALHDSLTGLANRSLFYDRVEQAIRVSRRENDVVAVMLMDLDRFKEVNDTLGHHNGDLLLKQIGGRLQRVLRESDTVARLGGDEFAILLPKVRDSMAAMRAAEKLLHALEEPFEVQGLALDIGASIGIALSPEHGETASTLVQRADVAMYIAKRSHAGFEIYAPESDEYTAGRLALVSELRRAMEGDELVLHYQPKVDLVAGKVAGAEALLRWNHPDRGFMPPSEFIPLAEHTGLIRQLTLWALNAALRQARVWRDAGADIPVSVNLSARNLADLNFPDEVAEILDRWQVPPTSLELEITESSIMADRERAIRVLTRLSAMGIRLSVDDFGTGYSSLSYLRKLPISEIKIDRSFVIGMSTNENDAVIVQSTVDLGRNLGLTVVAEGVENDEALNALASLGCHVAQGYFVSRPIKAADVLPAVEQINRDFKERAEAFAALVRMRDYRERAGVAGV